jgi:hypothetical protein
VAEQEHGIDPSRRDVIKKTAWAVPAIASFSLVNASPAAGAYSGRRDGGDRPHRPGHGSNQTYPGPGSNQTYPGHGSNQTKPGYGSNQTYVEIVVPKP